MLSHPHLATYSLCLRYAISHQDRSPGSCCSHERRQLLFQRCVPAIYWCTKLVLTARHRQRPTRLISRLPGLPPASRAACASDNEANQLSSHRGETVTTDATVAIPEIEVTDAEGRDPLTTAVAGPVAKMAMSMPTPRAEATATASGKIVILAATAGEGTGARENGSATGVAEAGVMTTTGGTGTVVQSEI